MSAKSVYKFTKTIRGVIEADSPEDSEQLLDDAIDYSTLRKKSIYVQGSEESIVLNTYSPAPLLG